MNDFDTEEDVELTERQVNNDKRRRQEEAADFKKVLSTYEGRRLIWRMLELSGVHSCSFSGEFPLSMAFSEGVRKIGTILLDQVFTTDPQSYILMRNEATKRDLDYLEGKRE